MLSGRGQGEKEHREEPGDGEDYADRCGHADCFEGAVRNAQTDEVPVRARFEQGIAVVCNGCKVMGRCRTVESGQSFVAHGCGDVEFLWGAGQEKEDRDGI